MNEQEVGGPSIRIVEEENVTQNSIQRSPKITSASERDVLQDSGTLGDNLRNGRQVGREWLIRELRRERGRKRRDR